MDRIVVVGASLAGLWACESLRGGGYTGTITLIGAESHQPYDRPPLSKALLKGDWEPERIQLRKPDEIDSLGLDLRLGVAATALDAASRTVTLESGEAIAADGVIIATGSAPRPLPNQPDLDGVTMLRTLDDSLALRRRLADQPRVVVIGAGFIGLEVAATAAQSGCAVTVLEGAPAPSDSRASARRWARSSPGSTPATASMCVAASQVAGIEGADGRVTGVRLGSGELVPADVVVVGIGVSPATEWLDGSGLEIRDGVVCNDVAPCRAGDLRGRGLRPLGQQPVRRRRRGDARRALVQRRRAGRRRGQEPARRPRRRSSRFRTRRCRSSGAISSTAASSSSAGPTARTRCAVIAGDLDGNFMAMYGHGGRLRGVLGVNMPKPVDARAGSCCGNGLRGTKP